MKDQLRRRLIIHKINLRILKLKIKQYCDKNQVFKDFKNLTIET